jgi:5,10-methylenetetrahydrofolate reductase
MKLDAGADFVMTQPLFHLHSAQDFFQRFQKLYGPIPVPIYAGLLAISSKSKLLSFTKLKGINLPQDLVDQLLKTKDHKTLFSESLGHALKLGRELLKIPFIHGLHLMGMNEIEIYDSDSSVPLLDISQPIAELV